MRFATWERGGQEEAGVLSLDMQSVHSFESAGFACRDMLAFIRGHSQTDLQVLREAAQRPGTALQQVRLLAPIPRPHHDILCLGLNYRDHVQESAGFDINTDAGGTQAVYFSKRVVQATGPNAPIHNYAGMETRLDYEAELAVVIGRDAKNVAREDAWEHVFGLMCFNDVSARDLQQKHNQWYFGKSLDGFAAFGPYIVSLDEFTLPLRLDIKSRVNGEVRQHSNTVNMIFTLPYVMAELSAGLTLDAGSIIATGTPAGVGAGFTPHRCMKAGDVCEVEIEGCGVLRNTIV